MLVTLAIAQAPSTWTEHHLIIHTISPPHSAQNQLKETPRTKTSGLPPPGFPLTPKENPTHAGQLSLSVSEASHPWSPLPACSWKHMYVQ